MSYNRAIPRDLFNEALLLKCLGRLMICAEKSAPIKIEVHHSAPQDDFGVMQSMADGCFFSNKIYVTVNRRFMTHYTTGNAKDDPWPLYLENETGDPIRVFDENGNLSNEFVAYFGGRE